MNLWLVDFKMQLLVDFSIERFPYFPYFLEDPIGPVLGIARYSSLVSLKLTQPTFQWVHCAPQEGGRVQGWESVF